MRNNSLKQANRRIEKSPDSLLQSKDELFSPSAALNNPNTLQQRSLGSNNTSDNTGLNKGRLKTMFLG